MEQNLQKIKDMLEFNIKVTCGNDERCLKCSGKCRNFQMLILVKECVEKLSTSER